MRVSMGEVGAVYLLREGRCCVLEGYLNVLETASRSMNSFVSKSMSREVSSTSQNHWERGGGEEVRVKG